MTIDRCRAVRDDLGPFMDGELDGTAMLEVSRHLAHCAACAAVLRDMQTIGGLLRLSTPPGPAMDFFDGLAGGVVSRAHAEAAESWRATLARACQGWHWAIVGGGSLAATILSTSLLSVVLAFGTTPERQGSLSALATNLGSPSGFLFVYASPAGPDAGLDLVTLQVENGRPAAPRLVEELAAMPVYPTATEADLVLLLQKVTTYDGRVLTLDELGPEQRLVAEAVLDELARLRSARQFGVSRAFHVHSMRLVTSTGVSAKRL